MDKIFFNFYKIIAAKPEIKLNYLDYNPKEEEQVKKLYTNSPNTLFIRSQDRIFCWGENVPETSKSELISYENNYWTYLKIFRDSLLYQFSQNKDKFKTKSGIFFKITFLEKDISEGEFKGLKFFQSYELDFLYLYFNDRYHLGFTISCRISEEIVWTKQDFIDNNISYNDLEFDKETGLVYRNAKSIYRLAKHFNYADRRKERLDTLNSIQNEYQKISDFVKTYFEDNLNELILPNELKILKLNRKQFPKQILNEPEKYFYKGIYPQNLYYKPILKKKISFNKPFSYDVFENTDINITVIYPKSEYESTATFFKDIEDELIKTFKIKKDKFKYTKIEIDNFDLKSYQKIIAQVKDTNLVVVLVSEIQESLHPNQSPYFFCKLKFMERGLNVQQMQIEKISTYLNDKANNITNYNVDNLALNIYAKLGGLAWTMKPKEPKNELVIGVGATTDKEGQPILGIASIFRGDGKYLFGKMTSITSMENYEEYLESLLIENINQYIEDGILETDEVFQLTFHLYKPAGKKNEIKALKKVIDNFKNYDFKYSFVHIGLGHNYRFFPFKTNFIQNNNIRGTFIKINNHLGFVSLSSDSSTFCKVEIDTRSNHVNLEETVIQVYQFAELSHTNYRQSSRPITIKYPNLMVGFAEKFKEIEGFYLPSLEIPDNSLWFI